HNAQSVWLLLAAQPRSDMRNQAILSATALRVSGVVPIRDVAVVRASTHTGLKLGAVLAHGAHGVVICLFQPSHLLALNHLREAQEQHITEAVGRITQEQITVGSLSVRLDNKI